MSFQQDPVIAQFFERDFLTRIKDVRRDAPLGLAARVAELHGQPPPRELAALLSLYDEWTPGYLGYAEWELDMSEADLMPAEGGPNLFERLVLQAQRDENSQTISNYFCNCIPVGRMSNGDRYVAHMIYDDHEITPVLVVDHTSGACVDYLTDSLSTLVYLNHHHTLYNVQKQLGPLGEEQTYEAVRQALQRLDGRTSLLGPFRELDVWITDADIASNLVRYAGVMRYRDRTGWIMHLLRTGHFSIEAFRRFDHREMDWRAALSKGGKLIDYPPAALYWLWRTYVFGETDRLGQMLKLSQASRSLVVRAAGQLIAEFQRGRRHLGEVRDIPIACEVARETSGFKPW